MQLTTKFNLTKLPRSTGGIRYDEVPINPEDPRTIVLGTIYLNQQAAKQLTASGLFPRTITITIEGERQA